MSPIDEVSIPALKRQFPHVDRIEDWRAQQSVRLLWDRVFDLEGRLQAAEATITQLTSASNTQETQLHEVSQKANQALAEAQLLRSEAASAADAALKDDHGLGMAGCAAAGATGDIGPFTGTDLTLENVGKVVCGVGTEWASLCVATATLAARQANADQLLDRIVWHLNQAGFAAARYPTPEGAPWHVLFDALSPDGDAPVRQQSYRVISYYPLPPEAWDPTDVMTVSMFSYGGQSRGVTTTPETGIPD
jgi:hypothetical protein